MNDLTLDLVILLAAAGASTGYAALLQRLHARYSPDYTWITVVGGNALIGGFLALFCLIGRLPWQAFWYLFFLNVAAGLPIIAWQIGQRAARRSALERRENGGDHGATHKRS